METNRIAFGSCNNQNLTNPLWDILTERNPAAFIWAGDAIYADTNIGNDWSHFPPRSIHQSATPEGFRQQYGKQRSNTSYQNFLKTTNATVFGTIDDHDYGMNNGDRSFGFKSESGVAFLDFVGEERDSLIYKRAESGYGVYGVKVFDFSRDDGEYLMSDEEAGLDADLGTRLGNPKSTTIENHIKGTNTGTQRKYEEKRVAVFVLDARANKTPWSDGFGAWVPNYDGDFLGERQWKWFESSIRKSNASINIIVNGLQVHSYRHPNSNAVELWSHFPKSRQRLYDVILQDSVKAPILLSGDVHMAQFLRKDCIKSSDVDKDDAKIRPLIEFTSSGMTHSWGTCFASSERFHKTWRYYPLHFFSTSLMTLCHWIFPMPDLMVSEKEKYDHGRKGSNLFGNGGAENAKTGQQYSLELNFGEIEFDWRAKTVTIRAIGEDIGAPPLLSASFSFDQLEGIEAIPGRTADIQTTKKRGMYLMDGNFDGDNFCMNHKLAPTLFEIAAGFVGVTSFMVVTLLGPQILFLLWIKKMLRRNKK